MNRNKNRIYSIKKLTLPRWRFKLFLLSEWIIEKKKLLSKKYEYRGKNFEFTSGWSGFALVYQEAGYDSRGHIQIYPFWGHFFFNVSNYKPYVKDEYVFGDDRREWGISYTHELASFRISRGSKYKYYSMPWTKDWIRTSKLMKDGSWEHETKGNRKEFYNDHIWGDKIYKEVHEYRYHLNNGKTQCVEATITVEEREWRYKILKWTKLFNIVDRSIDVEFSSQVGERSGTYKGGALGCGYTMKKNETPLQTLRRMEKERKFK